MTLVDYEAIFENAEVGIALNDPEEGTIGKVNGHYADLMGYSPRELEDMTIEEISADDPTFDQGAAMAKIEKALAGNPQKFDWLFERKDRSRFWAEVVLKRTMIGPEDRLLAFVRDISERKQHERALEQKNRRLNEFANIVSHDIRNPLNVAIGNLELVREEYDDARLDAVANAHTRMELLIEDLLSLARAGDTIGDITAVDLAACVESCWENVETLEAHLETDTELTIYADERRLQQILENLLRNAVIHGGHDVEITVTGLENGFCVEDNGPGIPTSERDAVLEPGHSSSESGSGYGLAIVRDIAEAHGWTITVTEGSTGGARFEFSGAKTG